LNKFFILLLRLLIAAALLSALVAAIFLAVDYLKTKDAFPPNTYLGNLNVSLLSREEAIRKIRNTPIEEIFFPTLTFIDKNESFTFPVQELGVYVLPEDTVDEAFKLTHNETYLKELRKRLTREQLVLPLRLALDENLTRQAIAEMAQKIDTPAKDAGFIFNEDTGGYHIIPDLPARKLMLAETLAGAKAALYQSKTELPLLIDYYRPPRLTEEELRAAPPVYRLAAYTTYYGTHDSPNRIHNIKLIASWLNNTLLLPDEVLSVAERVGDFTYERGFREAFVILGGELVPQLGGGTCQIGTTLYNAASLADLEILSRRNHSFYFNIYPLGRDAAVYPGQVDLKFKNNTGHPILIRSYADNKRLSFRIFGTPVGKKVTFSDPEIFLLDASGSFRPSTLREVIAVDRPFRTLIVRTVKDPQGKVLKEEVIRSYYKLYGEKSNVPIRRPESR